MKYVIMCGRGIIKGKPKQLTEIGGESIVGRTIRLLRSNGVQDIAISTNAKDFEVCGVPLIPVPDNTGRWINGCFVPIKEPVCYVFGDVFFSPKAIEKIVNTDTNIIKFFASAPPFAPQYHKPWAEPFAFKVVDTEFFQHCIKKVQEYAEMGYWHRDPIAWELWQVIRGGTLNKIDYTNYDVINDYTCDIDTEVDIQEFLRRWDGNENG